MKALALVLLAVTLAALVAPPAATQDLWQEEQITSGFATWRGGAKVWGDTVYYGESTTYDYVSNVYAWTQAQGSTLLLGGDGISRAPGAVWGDNLVISRIESGQHKLYLYSPGAGESPIATSAGNKEKSDIYENTVVYEDYRAGSQEPRVYIWDPLNGERRISMTETPQKAPKIWGDRIIWQQQGHEVWTWTPEGGATRIGYGDYSAIYQDRVVSWYNAWTEYPPGGNPAVYHPGYLNEWTPTGGFHTILEHNKSTSALETWGSLVVGSGFVWGQVSGFTSVTVPNPSLYDKRIATTYNNDYSVHIYTMIPEPSSFAALAAGLGLLGRTMRRRRSQREAR